MAHPWKRLAGRTRADFIDVKVRWLAQHLSRTRCAGADRQLLDFGCGDGLFIERLGQHGVVARIIGCDVSAVMLESARRRLTDQAPQLDQISDRLHYDDESFDVVIASAVLHHMEPACRNSVLQELHRVLVPGGWCFIFEHNPYHPAVRYIVRTTPIDRGACLLSPRSVRRSLEQAGLTCQRTRWLMFFPPRWTWTRRLEYWLQPLPFGGQYVVVAGKPPLGKFASGGEEA